MKLTAETNKLVKYVAYFLMIFVFSLVQETPGLLPEIFTCVPLLAVAAAISIALVETELPAMLFGLEAGLFLDIGTSLPLGVCCIIMTVVCCSLSAVSQRNFDINIPSVAVGSVMSLAVVFAAFWLVSVVIPGHSQPIQALINRFIPMYGYTLLTVPVVFIITYGVFKGLEYAE